MKSKLYIVIAAALSLFIAACGGAVSDVELAKAVVNARENGAIAEAARADAKLGSAKAEMTKLAIETARQGGYSAQANCNVMPQGLAGTSASRNFPSNAPTFYKEACGKEVMAMNAERSINKQRAIVAERNRVAKLAAKKAKADEAKRLAALKQKPKAHAERKS